MTPATMDRIPTARLVERDGRFRAFCNDCNWNCAWMDEYNRDRKTVRHMNLHRTARGLERIEEPIAPIGGE
jgi:hypothetical protein